MARVLILADDLSGAADCGIACVDAGLGAEVFLGDPISAPTEHAAAIDADSRGLKPALAAQRMHALTIAWASDPATVLFKKIDSTLRGHLGPELAAVLQARSAFVQAPVAILAPAFPSSGRTTLDGWHFVHGRPLHETEMWHYENMTGNSHISQMLQSSGLACAHLDLATIRGGLDSSVQRLHGVDVLVCDATHEEDLQAIAGMAAALGERAVWVGSAGLAYHLPQALDLGKKGAGRNRRPLATSGPALFVLGSASRRTWDQAAVLLSSSDTYGVVIPTVVLLGGPGTSEWQAFAEELQLAASRGADIVLLCEAHPIVDMPDRPRLSLALAEMTAVLRGKVGTLIASGGETARKVLDRWGVRSLRLQGELERGVPISTAILDPGHMLSVVTKAGDFGTPNILLQCLHWVKEQESAQ